MPRARSKPRKPKSAVRRAAAAGPPPTPAEKRLLALSREIARLPLAAAIEKLASAWAPNAPLPGEVAKAWTRSRGDKTAALALAYAGEQVRLSLQEILQALPPDRRGPIGAAPETLAWILLAACEAIAHEPPSAVSDRVRTLLELTGHAASRG
jgi:hypothetical protein